MYTVRTQDGSVGTTDALPVIGASITVAVDHSWDEPSAQHTDVCADYIETKNL